MTDTLDFVVPRVRDLPSSPTIAVAKRAQALRAEGIDVVDFGPGEPDFVTPEHIRRAAGEALDAGMTGYAPGRGLPKFRAAIARKLQRENGLRYDPETEIVVTTGAKQAIVEAVFSSVADGDEVIVFDPGWGSYDAIVRLAGGTPVHVQLNERFEIDPDRLAEAISSRTRLIIVGAPGNPSGHILRESEMEALRDVCVARDILLLSDEIYERIVYDGMEAISPASMPGMWDRTITINGMSKAYAMTGWRLGYVAAPAPFIAQLLKVQEHTVTAATTFAQAGGIVALDGPQEPIAAMVEEFSRRRGIIVEGLNSIPGVKCLAPDGAFYAFPDISATGFSGTALANLLLDHGVALTPGAGFGEAWDTHVRLSYATSEERIRTGLARIETALTRRG